MKVGILCGVFLFTIAIGFAFASTQQNNCPGGNFNLFHKIGCIIHTTTAIIVITLAYHERIITRSFSQIKWENSLAKLLRMCALPFHILMPIRNVLFSWFCIFGLAFLPCARTFFAFLQLLYILNWVETNTTWCIFPFFSQLQHYVHYSKYICSVAYSDYSYSISQYHTLVFTKITLLLFCMHFSAWTSHFSAQFMHTTFQCG